MTLHNRQSEALSITVKNLALCKTYAVCHILAIKCKSVVMLSVAMLSVHNDTNQNDTLYNRQIETLSITVKSWHSAKYMLRVTFKPSS